MIYPSSVIRKQIYSDPWDQCYCQLFSSVCALPLQDSQEVLRDVVHDVVWVPMVSEVNAHMTSKENSCL